jgi:hypothetical protein
MWWVPICMEYLATQELQPRSITCQVRDDEMGWFDLFVQDEMVMIPRSITCQVRDDEMDWFDLFVQDAMVMIPRSITCQVREETDWFDLFVQGSLLSNKQALPMRRMTTHASHANTDLTSQWWYTWFASRTPCASGRLAQFSGTCWFNTALNMLLLSPSIAKIMVGYWNMLPPQEQEQSKLDLSICLNPQTGTLRLMLHVVIYNLLIRGRKATWSNGNIVKGMAAMTKGLSMSSQRSANAKANRTNPDTKIAELHRLTDDGWDPSKGIRTVWKTLWGDPGPGSAVPYGVLTFPSESDQAAFVRGAQSSDTVHWTSSTVEGDEVLLLVEGRGSSLTAVPVLLVVKTTQGDSIVFELQSASVHSQTHAIAALTCGKARYIYDSNNYLTVEPNWPLGQYPKYHALLEASGSPYGPNAVFNRMDCALYVRRSAVASSQPQSGGSKWLSSAVDKLTALLQTHVRST